MGMSKGFALPKQYSKPVLLSFVHFLNSRTIRVSTLALLVAFITVSSTL